MGFRLNIAATSGDWISLFRKVKGDELLRFYATSASRLDHITPMHLHDLQGLGIARFGDLVQEDRYLVLPATEPAIPREIRLNSGGVRYALDQLTNLDSFTFQPGGLWKSDCYLIGEISSLHTFGLSINIAKKIRRVVRKTFHSCGAYWIGPECSDLYAKCTFTSDCRIGHQRLSHSTGGADDRVADA